MNFYISNARLGFLLYFMIRKFLFFRKDKIFFYADYSFIGKVYKKLLCAQRINFTDVDPFVVQRYALFISKIIYKRINRYYLEKIIKSYNLQFPDLLIKKIILQHIKSTCFVLFWIKKNSNVQGKILLNNYLEIELFRGRKFLSGCKLVFWPILYFIDYFFIDLIVGFVRTIKMLVPHFGKEKTLYQADIMVYEQSPEIFTHILLYFPFVKNYKTVVMTNDIAKANYGSGAKYIDVKRAHFGKKNSLIYFYKTLKNLFIIFSQILKYRARESIFFFYLMRTIPQLILWNAVAMQIKPKVIICNDNYGNMLFINGIMKYHHGTKSINYLTGDRIVGFYNSFAFSDYFLCWGKKYKNIYEKSGCLFTDCKIVGNQKIDQIPKISINPMLKADVNKIKQSYKLLVFYSDGKPEGYSQTVANEKIRQRILRFLANFLNENNNYYLIIKLHPGEIGVGFDYLQKVYSALIGHNRVKFVSGEWDSYQLALGSDLNLIYISTMGIETLGLGRKALYLYFSEFSKHFPYNRHAELVASNEDVAKYLIKKIIDMNLTSYLTSYTKVIGEYLYRVDGLVCQRVKKIFDDILSVEKNV